MSTAALATAASPRAASGALADMCWHCCVCAELDGVAALSKVDSAAMAAHVRGRRRRRRP